MTGGGAAGLGLIALGLSATIAFELVQRQAGPVATSTGASHVVINGVHSRAAVRTDVEARLSEILDRPMFSPDRRPGGVGKKSVSGLSRLTGIVIAGSRKLAIFAASPGGRPVVAEEGSRVNAYEVRTINDTGVTVVGPGGITVMMPVFDPTPPRLVPKPAAPTRPEQPATLKR